MDVILFAIFALIAIGCAVNLIVQTHPISSALSLIGVMGALAVLYLLLGAEFIAAAQIIVYAGAIMVLFVFVIMLLNAGAEKTLSRARLARYFGMPALVLFLGAMGFLVRGLTLDSGNVTFGAFTGGGAREVGMELFTRYLLPFEVTSILVLVAIIGAVVLGRKEMDR